MHGSLLENWLAWKRGPLESPSSSGLCAILGKVTIFMALMASERQMLIIQYLFENIIFVLEIDFLHKTVAGIKTHQNACHRSIFGLQESHMPPRKFPICYRWI